MGGSLSDYLGERFYRDTNARGYTIQWKNYETTLKWTAVAKRIEELIVAGRYMTEKELAYIPSMKKEFWREVFITFSIISRRRFYVRIRMAQIIIER